MQRALMCLNLYGREAIQNKLKKGLQTQKMHFSPVLELILIFFFKKKFFFASFTILQFTSLQFSCKQVKVSWLVRLGRNFDDYPCFQLFFTLGKHF